MTPRSPLSVNQKKKEMKKNRVKEAKKKSLQGKKKMGQEIEEIFRANKKKRKEFSGLAGEGSTKTNVGTSKEEKSANKKKMASHVTEEKIKGFSVDQTSENRSKRRRTADGLVVYSAEELGIENPDAGNTPLCPFDCSCCF